MKNPFKSIWNFLFPQKEKETYKTFDEFADDYLKKGKDETRDCHFNTDREIAGFSLRKLTKNQFRNLALSKGYEARYSGRERFFYLHKIQFN